MHSRLSRTELAVWSAVSIVAVPLATRLPAVAQQGPTVVIMLANFGLTLPGRAPVWLVVLSTWLAVSLPQVLRGYTFLPALLFALIPAFVGAGVGKLAGSSLDTAASKLAQASVSDERPWHDRPLSTRFVLAVSLVAIAAMGVSPLTALFANLDYSAGSLLALTWMVMSLLGWIGLTPLILSERAVGAKGDDSPGIRPAELLVHLVVVLSLAAVHAAIVVVVSAVFRIPITPGWSEMTLLAFKIFLPLDALAYLTINALGFASDVERHRRNAQQREAALEAEILGDRLAALRARLNPHFLFNAMNSIIVLARAGKGEETSRLVEGITSLLRYVLDERRTNVPLREELAFARRYLTVQQARFGDRLAFDVAADPAVEDVLVPQLLLQPVVENAVEHGVAKTLDGGRVSIAVDRSGESIRIAVCDDGPGPVVDATDSEGIGLANTRERLGRLYGDRARLMLSPASSARGTCVEILVPMTS
jgi:hypothetical protein